MKMPNDIRNRECHGVKLGLSKKITYRVKVTGVKYAFTINAPTIFDQELNRKDSAFTVSTVETFVSDTKVEVG